MKYENVCSGLCIELPILEEIRIHHNIFQIIASGEYKIFAFGEFSGDTILVFTGVCKGNIIDFQVQTLLLRDGESHRNRIVVEFQAVIAGLCDIPHFISIRIEAYSVISL